jgi:hypothetical protein
VVEPPAAKRRGFAGQRPGPAPPPLAGSAATQFRPGKSGNPKGRPAGSRNKTTAFCASLLGGDAGDIMAKVIELAKTGDGVALRLCVERLLPVRASRDRAVDVQLPDIAAVGDLVEASAAVIRHAASGAITLSEAKEFMSLLEAQRKLVETADLALRLDVLEARQVGKAQEREIGFDTKARMRRLEEE